MKRYTILFTVLAGFTLCIQPARGQFVTKRLALLARATGITLNDTMIKSEQHDFDSICMFHNHPLHVKITPQGEISHLGYSLFDSNLRQEYPSVVYDFIERYFLELDLDENEIKRQLRMKKDGVVCKGNPIDMVSKNTKIESVRINNEINHKYLIELQSGDKSLTMAFNADYQLILGADDIELEEILEQRIKRIASKQNYAGDFILIFDRYGYVKDTITFSRQDVVALIEEDCEELSLQSKTETEEVMFAINRDLGFVHLASFKPNEARLIAYIPIHDASEEFINRMVPPIDSEKKKEHSMDLAWPKPETETETNTDN